MCNNCTLLQLPFAVIGNDDLSPELSTDGQQYQAPRKDDAYWDKLPYLEVSPENQSNRPLSNNPDPDLDDFFHVNKPVDHGYKTPSPVVPVMKTDSDMYLFSLTHVNCRNLYNKLDENL